MREKGRAYALRIGKNPFLLIKIDKSFLWGSLQGYYYSKPVPEDDFTKYISDFNANTSEEEA